MDSGVPSDPWQELQHELNRDFFDDGLEGDPFGANSAVPLGQYANPATGNSNSSGRNTVPHGSQEEPATKQPKTSDAATFNWLFSSQLRRATEEGAAKRRRVAPPAQQPADTACKRTRVATLEEIGEMFSEAEGIDDAGTLTSDVRLSIAAKRQAAMEKKQEKREQLTAAIALRRSTAQAKKKEMLRRRADDNKLKALRIKRNRRVADLKRRRPCLKPREGPGISELDASIRQLEQSLEATEETNPAPAGSTPTAPEPSQKAPRKCAQGWNPNADSNWQLGASQVACVDEPQEEPAVTTYTDSESEDISDAELDRRITQAQTMRLAACADFERELIGNAVGTLPDAAALPSTAAGQVAGAEPDTVDPTLDPDPCYDREALLDLIDLHASGSQITWPKGLDERTAKLYVNAKRHKHTATGSADLPSADRTTAAADTCRAERVSTWGAPYGDSAGHGRPPESNAQRLTSPTRGA